ncbi:hypothetical protein Tco_1283746 [Tanacetum coccineum]
MIHLTTLSCLVLSEKFQIPMKVRWYSESMECRSSTPSASQELQPEQNVTYVIFANILMNHHKAQKDGSFEIQNNHKYTNHDLRSEVDMRQVKVVPSFPSNNLTGTYLLLVSDPAGDNPAEFLNIHQIVDAQNQVPTRSVNTIHPHSQILGDLASPVLTRAELKIKYRVKVSVNDILYQVLTWNLSETATTPYEAAKTKLKEETAIPHLIECLFQTSITPLTSHRKLSRRYYKKLTTGGSQLLGKDNFMAMQEANNLATSSTESAVDMVFCGNIISCVLAVVILPSRMICFCCKLMDYAAGSVYMLVGITSCSEFYISAERVCAQFDIAGWLVSATSHLVSAGSLHSCWCNNVSAA